jgi:Flp pilus assembly protein TadB
LVGAAAAVAPSLVGAKARREARLARSEAVASWAEMVRDTLAGGAHLQMAVAAAARTPPPPIEAEVAALAARAERDRLEVALHRFATDVADPTADLVVASLLLALRARAKDLDRVLGAAAVSARAQLAMRRKVDAGRARARQGLRLILGVSAAWAVWAVVAWRDYMAPFGTVGGQVVLVNVGAIFAAAMVAMERLAREGERERILAGDGGEHPW